MRLKLKSAEEILKRVQELISRYRRRYIRRNLRPCPLNCKLAKLLGRNVMGCTGCGSRNPEFCKDQGKFAPLYDKQELVDQFNQGLRDPQVLLQDYRDIVAFQFVFDMAPDALPESIIQNKEKR